MKKFFAIALALVLFVLPLQAMAAEETVLVRVRIQGNNECYYNETLRREAGQSALDVLKSIADTDLSLKIEGLETGYVTSVQGEAAGAFGGWDGWLYRVNGVEPMISMEEYILENGDSLVVFFGDPYGVGMQYPEVDLTRAAEGIVSFVSDDTTYDANGNAVVTTNPVADATVTWDGVSYVTNENGQITVAPMQEGQKVAVSIERFEDSGLATVLAFAPGASVTIPAADAAGVVPPTGMTSTVMLAAALAALGAAIAGGKKRAA